MLSCTNLVKSFGQLRAVDGVSFSVDETETYGLLGPNGAGKTTTISMVAGLLSPDAGDVRVAGRAMGPRAVTAKEAVGLVPQDLAIYPDLTARENLVFFARLYGQDRRQAAKRTSEVLQIVGLDGRADDRVSAYSGGMKRRLNIGVGMLHEPTLLILDEPTVGVDPQSRNAILDAVSELSTAGMAVLYTTHYMEEAERLCDRIGIIDEGRLVAEGTRRELLASIVGQERVRMEVTGDLAVAAARCAEVDGVDSAEDEDGAVICLVTGAARMLPALMTAVTATGAEVTAVEVAGSDLEAVFLHLTGKALRDQ